MRGRQRIVNALNYVEQHGTTEHSTVHHSTAHLPCPMDAAPMGVVSKDEKVASKSNSDATIPLTT